MISRNSNALGEFVKNNYCGGSVLRLFAFASYLALIFASTLFEASASASVNLDLQGRSGMVECIRFSPDGKLIAACGGDNSIILWDAETGQLIRTMKGHTGPVHSVAFFPNAKSIVSGGADATVKIWSHAPVAAVEGHVWTPAVQGESDISASRSGAAMYTAFECGRCGRWP